LALLACLLVDCLMRGEGRRLHWRDGWFRGRRKRPRVIGVFLNQIEMLPAEVVKLPPWWRRRWVAFTAAIIVAATVAAGFGVRRVMREIQPMLRRKVVDTLAARFHSPVELDRLSLSMRNGLVVTGGGLRIFYLTGPTEPDARPNAPPMLSVDDFEFDTGWRELLKPTTRVVLVKVRGLKVNIPTKE